MVCYIVKGGKLFVGGFGMLVLMFGKIYMSNIILDFDIGIGNWMFEDFECVVWYGVLKNGDNLYLVMLYVLYVKINDDDV